MRKLFGAVVAGLASFALVAGAQAAVVGSVVTSPGNPPVQNPSIDPSGSEGTVGLQTGDSGLNWISPWDDNVTPYWSVQADSAAIYTFGANTQILEILWGTVDSYNSLRLYATLADLNNDTPFEVITGTQVALLAGLVGPDSATHLLVSIVADQVFQYARFISTGANGFEHSILRYSDIPVPGAALLLLSGLAGLSFASRRRKAA